MMNNNHGSMYHYGNNNSGNSKQPAYIPGLSSHAVGGGPSSSIYDPSSWRFDSSSNNNTTTHQQLLATLQLANYQQQQQAAAVAAASLCVNPFPQQSDNSSAVGHSHRRLPSLDILLLQHPELLRTFDPLPSEPMHVPSQVSSAAVAPPASKTAVLPRKDETAPAWMNEIKLNVPSLSLEPMSGSAVVDRLQENMDDVVTKYIPCVDFLVSCQQELRRGLELHRRSARQYFSIFVDHLPQKFYVKNQFSMESESLHNAYEELQKLRQDAKRAERQGCEAVKSSFLGGMKDGESWGLRKWLSKHGNGLRVCTDLECILNACQKLDRNAESTKKLSDVLRPKAKHVLHKLQTEIPSSYQQHSTAHPYLPFFHRLEAALRGVSNFDPEDDDVICLDDSDDEDNNVVEVEDSDQNPVQEVQQECKKRKRPQEVFLKSDSDNEEDDDENDDDFNDDGNGIGNDDNSVSQDIKPPPAKRMITATNLSDDSSSSGESADEESVVEIIDVVKPTNTVDEDWTCQNCSMFNIGGSTSCFACGDDRIYEKVEEEKRNKKKGASGGLSWPVPLKDSDGSKADARLIAINLDKLAALFIQNQQGTIRPRGIRCTGFWEGETYARALCLFSDILRHPGSSHFLDRVNDDHLIQAGHPPFSHVIKHPITLREIAASLLGDELEFLGYSTGDNTGRLSDRGLSKWNMWMGKDLLQAIDLVLLNSLAYGKNIEQGRSQHRSLTNKIRKALWDGITEIVGTDRDNKKQFAPMRRSETSGFVVYKIKSS